jgi:cysteine desulfurase
MVETFADYNATTPIDAGVLEAMLPYLESQFGNPSSRHHRGTEAKAAVAKSRQQVADLLDCDADEITFCAGATECNNWVLKGFYEFLPDSAPPMILSSAIEHPSILETLKFLQHRGWAQHRLVGVDGQGVCLIDSFKNQRTSVTKMATLMLANNETGAIQPVAALAQWASSESIWVHSDAAQACGKFKFSVRDLGVDSLTLAGHKLYAPKGIGALYLRRGRRLEPLLHGPAQEGGQRAGTENVASIVGLGQACEIARKNLDQESSRILGLRNQLFERLTAELPDCFVVNGPPIDSAIRVPNTLSLNFKGVDGHRLLSVSQLACSTGPACHDGDQKLSHVLQAMGVDWDLGRGAVRVSLGRYSKPEDVDSIVRGLSDAYRILRPCGQKF